VSETFAVAVLEPDVPVIVMVARPVVAVLLAVNVSVLVVAVGFGLNAAVTPLGTPEAESVTLPENPPEGVTVIVVVALAPPSVTLICSGDAASVKPPPPVPPVMVSEMVVVFTNAPDVPVTVIVDVPAVAVLATFSERCVPVVEVFGLNAAVTPVGKPLAANDTVPVKPPVGVIVIAVRPVPPGATESVLGEAESEKLAVVAEFTVNDTSVVAVSDPDVPVIVTVTVPTVAVELAVKVSVLEVPVGFGLKPAVTPVGKPDAPRVTVPLKPLTGTTLIVLVPVLLCVTATLEGDALSEKLGVEVVGQALTRFAAFTVPMPVAKSQPLVVA